MIQFILIYLVFAVIGDQIATSSLSFKIKRMFGLVIPTKRLINYSKIKPKGITSLITMPVKLYALTKLFLIELINCAYCTTYHVAWITTYLYFDFSLVYSLFFAFFALFWINIIERLKR